MKCLHELLHIVRHLWVKRFHKVMCEDGEKTASDTGVCIESPLGNRTVKLL